MIPEIATMSSLSHRFHQQKPNLWPLLSISGGRSKRKLGIQHDAMIRGDESAAYNIIDDAVAHRVGGEWASTLISSSC